MCVSKGNKKVTNVPEQNIKSFWLSVITTCSSDCVENNINWVLYNTNNDSSGQLYLNMSN